MNHVTGAVSDPALAELSNTRLWSEPVLMADGFKFPQKIFRVCMRIILSVTCLIQHNHVHVIIEWIIRFPAWWFLHVLCLKRHVKKLRQRTIKLTRSVPFRFVPRRDIQAARFAVTAIAVPVAIW